MTARFQSDWLIDPDFNFWLAEVKNDSQSAKCKLCNVTFSLSNMGKTAIKSHAKGLKHISKVKNCKTTTTLKSFLSQPQQSSTETTNHDSSEKLIISNPIMNQENEPRIRGSQNILSSFLLKEEVSRAEIIWCIQTLMTHKSMRSAGSDVQLFKKMFSDSQIAIKMELQRSKIAYSILYGIAPYYKNRLMESIASCDHFVIGFDESLNKVCQETQIDINIRFWSTEKNEVCTRYLTSAFLRRTRASDLLLSFKETLLPLIRLDKILQISMDGPNVNHKFFRDLKAELQKTKEINNPMVLDMGSCGLHNMHGAFKRGIEATNWNIVQFLSSIYYLFKDVPTRRAQLTEYSGSNLYPKKFCAVRWVENDSVAARAIEIIPNVKKMVEGLQRDKKEPTSASYKVVTEALSDPFLPAKLEFFRSIAAESQPFLQEYQTDAPMAPFLHSSLVTVLQNIMQRFIKADVLKSANSLSSIDLTDKNNFISYNQIDLGFGTNKAIRELKTKKNITDLMILQFRKDTATALKAFTEKLLARSPLLYKLTKAVSCFDPSLAHCPEVRSRRLKSLLTILNENNWISGIEADEISRDFNNLCSQPSAQQLLTNYSRANKRLDHFWNELIFTHANPQSLVKLLKIVMILSHGNANIERGFSVNSECLVENMKNETLIAQRLIYDSVLSETNGDVATIDVPKSLVHSYRNSRTKLSEEIERRKKEAATAESEDLKRKRVANEKKNLASKKAKLLAEIQAIDDQIQNLQ